MMLHKPMNDALSFEVKRLEEYIERSGKRFLIFDFDETLVRLLLPWEVCLGSLPEVPLVKKSGYIEQYNNGTLSLDELQNSLIARFGESMKKKILENNIHFETTLLQGVEPYAALLEWIASHRGYTMFLWSSNTRQAVERAFQFLHFIPPFAKIITRNDVTYLKPNPEGFSLIYERGVSKQTYILIGNSENDKRAASLSGIDYFQISYFQ